MSYILQALEKSEKQRQEVKQSNDREIVAPVPVSDKGPIKVYLGALALLLLMMPLALVFVSQMPAQIPKAVVNAESDDKIVSAISSELKSVSATSSLPVPASDRLDESVESLPADPLPVFNDVMSIHELEEGLLAKMPAIVVSSHIYSSVPEYRKVRINGEGLIEGQALSADLRLVSIGKTFLIFDLLGKKIQVPALKGWQP